MATEAGQTTGIELRESLASRYADPEDAELALIPGMGHALAEEPGTEPAAQTEHAAQVDAHAVHWLQRRLTEPAGKANGG